MEFLTNLPPVLAVIVSAMLPVTEVNAAIPLGIGVYHLSPVLTCLLATLGTLTVVAVLLPIFDRATKWVRSWHPKLDGFIDRVFAVTHHRHSKEFERWGSIALFLYVALPGPLTGVWSASLLAYLFGIKYRHALVSIGLGSLAASILVTLATVGVITLSRL